MLNYRFTLTNKFNGKTITLGTDTAGNFAEDVGRGIILQSYPGFELEVRNEEKYKSGQHGIWDFLSYYGKRNITFQGYIIGKTHAEVITYERLMQQVLSLPAQPVVGVNDGYVELKWEDDFGNVWLTDVKIQQDLQFSRPLKQTLVANFFVSLKATNPFVLSETQYSISGLRGWRQGQFILPGFLPNTIDIVFNNAINLYQAVIS